MNVSKITLTLIVVASLVVGSLLGSWYGAHRNLNLAGVAPTPRSGNHIRMEIENDTRRAVLVPEVGDTIMWFTQPTRTTKAKPVTVHFQHDSSPCNYGGDVAACDIVKEGIFEYQCVDPTCEDPGVDPRSNTSIAVKPTETGGPKPTGTGGPKPTGTGGMKPAETAAESGSEITASSLQTVVIKCDKDDNPQPDTDLSSVARGQKFRWIAGSSTDFTIHITPATANVQFCEASPSNDIQADPTVACKVKPPAGTKAQYTVDLCTNKTKSFPINVTR